MPIRNTAPRSLRAFAAATYAGLERLRDFRNGVHDVHVFLMHLHSGEQLAPMYLPLTHG
jgi:hypothetical protein